MKSPARVLLAGVATLATVGALVGCSAGGDDESDSGKTELRVATFPPGADAAAYEAFAAQEAQFEDENPDIDIIGVEYEWEGPTFAVQLAGGSLPDVFTVPFTDAKTLLENDQLMDVTDGDGRARLHRQLQPDHPRRASPAPTGNIYGFPRQAYANAPARTTASCSRRPGSTPTARRRRGTRCASTPSRSTTRPARPATRRWRSTTPAAGS